jgi:hypothetical protein
VQQELRAKMPFLIDRQRFSDWGRKDVSKESSRALGGVRPVSQESIGSWRDHKGRVLAQLERHGSIDRELIELGYERDAGWREALNGIEPDPSPSVYDEDGAATGRFAERLAAYARSLRFHRWRLIETARYRLGASRREDLERA